MPGNEPAKRLRGHIITHLDTGEPSLLDIRNHFVDQEKAVTNQQFFNILADTVREFWSDRTDMGDDCQHRGPYLRQELCQIGCIANRSMMPIFACRKHGECCPWRWEQKKTMQCCAACESR